MSCLSLLLACGSRKPQETIHTSLTPASSTSGPSPVPTTADKEDPESYTNLLIHNVIIDTNSRMHMRVKLMRARMYPVKAGVAASFDDVTSFRLEIAEGLMGMNVREFADLLKSGALKGSPLRNLEIQPSGSQLKITGTLRKLFPLPVQLLADVSAAPDHHQIRLHAVKISVLKIPFKRVMGMFRLRTSDFFSDKHLTGITVSGDDIDINVNRLMPGPRTQGNLTEVQIWKSGELMEYYGHPREEAIQVQQWRNFMRMRGGTLNFGKLTMHNADLLLVDTSKSDWMNFDVEHYQEQMVFGETHITPSAGLQIFLPDMSKIPEAKRNRDISVQWMKNRNVTPPEGQ